LIFDLIGDLSCDLICDFIIVTQMRGLLAFRGIGGDFFRGSGQVARFHAGEDWGWE